MPVPKKKTSKRRRNHRRSHLALKERVTVRCRKCGELKLPHRACKSCGYYERYK